jgi:selenocysteine-specific elongation factor
MILGTAGHIDHGKSALVQALTGQAMDPLAEEQRRGITLDLHFAPYRLPDGSVLGVVDVPGHEDLIRSMSAGAAGMDLVLLVIAADDGIMPQTREHLAVLEQLGVPAGIPVLTKMDLAEPAWLELVSAEVAEWLAGSPVRFGPPVAVSARTGGGLDALRQAIAGAVHDAGPRRAVADLARLPVDRAFTLAGAGTVVTGTCWSGSFRAGEQVRILPAGIPARIRSLEEHSSAVTASSPGQRLAVGLAGVEVSAVRRGATLVQDGAGWEATTVMDARLNLLAGAGRPLSHQRRVRVHIGTAEVIARVHLREELLPGRTALARLVLESPLVARGGDRLLLRSYSPVGVIGGGTVLDPLPPPGRPLWTEGLDAPDPGARLRALTERRPRGLLVAQLPILLGITEREAAALLTDPQLARQDGMLVPATAVERATAQACALVAGHHAQHPAEPGLSVETARRELESFGAAGPAALERVLADGRLVLEGAALRAPGFRPAVPGGDAQFERVMAAIESAGLAPQTVAELEASLGIRGLSEVLRLAARQGRVVPVERDRYYARPALQQLVEVLRQLGGRGPITPAAVREATGVSRKYLIGLLEWADREGITRRQGEARVLLGNR